MLRLSNRQNFNSVHPDILAPSNSISSQAKPRIIALEKLLLSPQMQQTEKPHLKMIFKKKRRRKRTSIKRTKIRTMVVVMIATTTFLIAFKMIQVSHERNKWQRKKSLKSRSLLFNLSLYVKSWMQMNTFKNYLQTKYLRG